MNRPTEQAVENRLDFLARLVTFLNLLSPEELTVCALFEDGMDPVTIKKHIECSNRTVYGRVERAKKSALLVFDY
jgi:DNA-binding CsgD family transcriptional regulator